MEKEDATMMTIKEIYEEFDKIGCLTFATVSKEGYPETRIAHFKGSYRA